MKNPTIAGAMALAASMGYAPQMGLNRSHKAQDLPHQGPRECARRIRQGLGGYDYRNEQAKHRARWGYAVCYKNWQEQEGVEI